MPAWLLGRVTCGGAQVLFEDFFHCTDLGTQLKPVIEAFFASVRARALSALRRLAVRDSLTPSWQEAYRTGVPEREFPAPPIAIDTTRVLNPPMCTCGGGPPG